MSFKEKITWLTLATMMVTYGVYFTLVAQMGLAVPLISIAALFAVVTAAQVVSSSSLARLPLRWRRSARRKLPPMNATSPLRAALLQAPIMRWLLPKWCAMP